MKRTVAILLALTLIFALAACGEETVEQSMDTVVTAVEAAISTEGMVELDSDYISNMMKLEPEDYEECRVMLTNVGTSIDEYGIFKGTDSTQAAEIKSAVEDYLQLRLDSWMPEYLPDEFPKLQNAKVWSDGNFVMYAILSTEEADAAETAFEDCFM